MLPGQSPAEEFATLAHEAPHELMHCDERRSSTTKRIRETEAKAVAFVISSAIGLETGSAAQDYVVVVFMLSWQRKARFCGLSEFRGQHK